MDTGLACQALRDGQVGVAVGPATDGRIEANGLVGGSGAAAGRGTAAPLTRSEASG
jgi:hypothetical protein